MLLKTVRVSEFCRRTPLSTINIITFLHCQQHSTSKHGCHSLHKMAIMGLRERTSVGLDAHDLLDIAAIGLATFVMAVAILNWAFPLDGSPETSKARTVKRRRGVKRNQASSPSPPGLVRETSKGPPGLVRGNSIGDDQPPFLERGLSRSFTSGLRKPTADMASAEQRQALSHPDHQGSSRSIRSDGGVFSRTSTATGGITLSHAGTLPRVSSACKTLSEDAKTTAKGDLKRPPKASKSMSSGSRYFAEIIRRQSSG